MPCTPTFASSPVCLFTGSVSYLDFHDSIIMHACMHAFLYLSIQQCHSSLCVCAGNTQGEGLASAYWETHSREKESHVC